MRGTKAKAIRRKVKEIRERYGCAAVMTRLAPKVPISVQIDVCRRRYKKLVKAGILTICALLFVNLSHADTIELLRGVDPHKFKEVMLEKGFKLDFELKEKTDDSWGVLGMDKKGMYISTYDSINMDNLPLVTEAMWASMEIVKESDD